MITDKMQDNKLLADIWYQLSVLKRRRRCLDKATYFGEQALAQYRHALNEPAGEAAALHTLGAIVLQQRTYETAEARLKASVVSGPRGVRIWAMFCWRGRSMARRWMCCSCAGRCGRRGDAVGQPGGSLPTVSGAVDADDAGLHA